MSQNLLELVDVATTPQVSGCKSVAEAMEAQRTDLALLLNDSEIPCGVLLDHLRSSVAPENVHEVGRNGSHVAIQDRPETTADRNVASLAPFTDDSQKTRFPNHIVRGEAESFGYADTAVQHRQADCVNTSLVERPWPECLEFGDFFIPKNLSPFACWLLDEVQFQLRFEDAFFVQEIEERVRHPDVNVLAHRRDFSA